MKTKTPVKSKEGHARGVLRRLFVGIVICLLSFGVTSLFEKTLLGQRIEMLTYEVLQKLLSSNDSSGRLPVQVVDISKIPGGKDGPTPRQPLMEIVKAIAEQRPKAIGVDIDFGPGPDGWKVDQDPEFLDFCLTIKKDMGIPIFLAVYETQSEPADVWLGLPKYKELAAASLVDPRDMRRLPRWIQAKDVPDKLQTMSAALADSYRQSLPDPYGWLKKTIEVTADDKHGIERRGEDQMLFGWALVNYSKLTQIQDETLPSISAKSIIEASERFTGKMVLLGDATHFEDSFNVPGQSGTVAGVHVIACAAFTLAVEPLFEFNSWARSALDLFFAILLILAIEKIRTVYVNKRPGSRFYRAQSWCIAIAIFVVFLFGLTLIAWFHIMWFDFPVVIFASLLHPRIEHWVGSFWKTRST